MSTLQLSFESLANDDASEHVAELGRASHDAILNTDVEKPTPSKSGLPTLLR